MFIIFTNKCSRGRRKRIGQIFTLLTTSKNIIILCGAGISVSCRIPDFRTPKTGLYDNLQKYNFQPLNQFLI